MEAGTGYYSDTVNKAPQGIQRAGTQVTANAISKLFLF